MGCVQKDLCITQFLGISIFEPGIQCYQWHWSGNSFCLIDFGGSSGDLVLYKQRRTSDSSTVFQCF